MYLCRNQKLMPLKYIIIILIFIGLFRGGGIAGNPPGINICENSVYAFKFGVDDVRSLNNYFVKEMARYNYLNLYKIQYTLNYELEVNISEKPGGYYEIESNISRNQMEGDIYYEKFDLSDVLMPSGYSFEISKKMMMIMKL